MPPTAKEESKKGGGGLLSCFVRRLRRLRRLRRCFSCLSCCDADDEEEDAGGADVGEMPCAERHDVLIDFCATAAPTRALLWAVLQGHIDEL